MKKQLKETDLLFEAYDLCCKIDILKDPFGLEYQSLVYEEALSYLLPSPKYSDEEYYLLRRLDEILKDFINGSVNQDQLFNKLKELKNKNPEVYTRLVSKFIKKVEQTYTVTC